MPSPLVDSTWKASRLSLVLCYFLMLICTLWTVSSSRTAQII
jgi:hypothetical protein